MAALIAVPVTVALAAVQVAAWTVLVRQSIPFTRVGLNYDAVLGRREYWRLATAPLAHFDAVHCLVDLWALWQFGGAQERARGSASYLFITGVLALASQGIELALYHALIKRCRLRAYRALFSLGYSAVLIAWVTLAAAVEPVDAERWRLPLGLSIAPALAPLVSVLMVQVLVKRSSLVGHVAGLLAGLLVFLVDSFFLGGTLGPGELISADGVHAGGGHAAAGSPGGGGTYWYACLALLLCVHFLRIPVRARARARAPPTGVGEEGGNEEVGGFIPVVWIAPDRMVHLDRGGDPARATAATNPLQRIRALWEAFELARRQRRQRPPPAAAPPDPPS